MVQGSQSEYEFLGVTFPNQTGFGLEKDTEWNLAAVKGYVYIWIYISILASTFMSTDTFSIFPMEPISIH